ncbi:hypothetical protein [Paenibacillus sp. sgz500992]|uniref:hypothetical protein n=1 Tax=Paenibacillus sp. sgz500992 TaxID=3242476 RepID=UPI0036D214E3
MNYKTSMLDTLLYNSTLRKSGFQKTFGYTCSHLFLLVSVKAGLIRMNPGIDKRSCGYSRRKKALLSAPHLISELLDRAIAFGVSAAYVLIGSWFTMPP